MYDQNVESATQERVIKLFCEKLGYEYLGDWRGGRRKSPIEENLLIASLAKRGYSQTQAKAAADRLRQEALLNNRPLYDANKNVYELLRYGVKVQTQAAEPHTTVFCIDWQNPENNDFAIAEEVTLAGGRERRPDLVLYINGIAVAIIELKKASVSIVDGIGQLISNQRPQYNPGFFTAAQWLMAGNTSEGLRYGTIGTPAKNYLAWKEECGDNSLSLLDRQLMQICEKHRFIELMHDFVLFDNRIKKLPRPHQYHALKKAQEAVKARAGGIIWHSQGSGKSLVMVLLAGWILENLPSARVLIVTDRVELDCQIERVFHDAGQAAITHISETKNLWPALKQHEKRLLCVLIHKFARGGQREDLKLKEYIEALKKRGSLAVGDFFVFVDECHRSQGGDLYHAMKATLPSAVFIGFTGTPLLKKDKKTTLELFGRYIHVYKFDEAVRDNVILDLLYESRDIDQRLSSPEKVDQLFEERTKNLNDWRREELKHRWATMQKLLSSRERMEKITGEICFDFEIKNILKSGFGNAILAAASIRDACKYYELFERSSLKGKCAIVTSYSPSAKDAAEDMGAETESERQFIARTYEGLLKDVVPRPGKTKAETYEELVKEKFIKEPGEMRLIIVVDKLLTGFDAPACSYLYIDKSMRDHALFQAICRTNRVARDEADWKDYGRIVDFKDLFRQLQETVTVYASELAMSPDGQDPQIRLKKRLQAGKAKLDAALETFMLVCEPVEPPKTDLEYIRYFCGNQENPEDLANTSQRRRELYLCVAKFLRAYANIEDELLAAGYGIQEISRIKEMINFAAQLRRTIKEASGEYLDSRPWEADMRDLLDRYVSADDPRVISRLDDAPLLEIVARSGIKEAIAKRFGKFAANKEAVAEAVANNARNVINTARPANPEFYERMSKALADLIELRRAKAIAYEEFLRRITDKVLVPLQQGHDGGMPASCDTAGKRALYENLGGNEKLALELDADLRQNCPHGWRRTRAKSNVVKQILSRHMPKDRVESFFEIILTLEEY